MRRGVREGGSGLGQTPFPHKDWGPEPQNRGGPGLEQPALGSVRRGVGAGSDASPVGLRGQSFEPDPR